MHTPGAEAQFYGSSRAKAKALAYLDAKAYQMRKRYLDAKAPPPDAKALFDSEDLPFGSVKSWRLPWVRLGFGPLIMFYGNRSSGLESLNRTRHLFLLANTTARLSSPFELIYG
jgi:hypothetical protein